MIDHEGAFTSALKRNKPSLNSLELDRFYDHVFYSAISPSDAGYRTLLEGLGRMVPSRLEKLLGEIPISWQVKEDLEMVCEHLLWVYENREEVCSLIRERLS